QIQDIYKLVHQAALGSEHALTDIDAAREALNHELSEIVQAHDEPLIDEISADGHIVRVHLRSYSMMGGDPVELLDAFVRTAEEYKGSVDRLRQYWAIVERMAESGDIPYPLEALRMLFAEMEAKGFPAIHHSQKYKQAYKPSYRVVAREFLPITLSQRSYK
ncbi:MAG: hypothetical protein U9R58_06950, partial [Chloroflexota bacterium]|nr:hypothetical protein [Chloroflexota bacterium]